MAPVPRSGDVVVGRDAVGRVLRVSHHPRHGRVVLSIWQGSECLATLRLAPEDLPELVGVLTAAAGGQVAAATAPEDPAAAPDDPAVPMPRREYPAAG